jgi:iron complex outermembrane receptor protein
VSGNHSLKSRILLSSSAVAIGALMSAGLVHGAYAQDNASAQQPKEIVVTGSRIVRRDYTANSPIMTLNSQKFEDTANVALEATLNKLPQFSAAGDLMGTGPGGAGDIQPTAVNSPGAATASLRGLGPNRNVVLVDGRRPMPVNGLNVVDLNSIPSAAIERVEVITGGASAVYGPDAVVGVVNFILKKNFEGLDFDTQYGISERGDDEEFKASALMGANFADDRGNVMLGVEHYTRGKTLNSNRDFYKKGWADPTTASNAFFASGAFWVPSPTTGGCPSPGALSTAVGAPPVGASTCFPFASLVNVGVTNPANTANGSGIYLQPIALGFGSYGFSNYTGPMDGLNQTTGYVFDNFGDGSQRTVKKTNWTTGNLLAPLTRWSSYAQAHFDINEYLTAFINGSFTSTKTQTTQIPTPFINGWGVLIPYDSATDGAAVGHPVPAGLAALLNSRANPDASWQLNLIPNPDNGFIDLRGANVTNTTWQVQFGFDGKIPSTDWTFELLGMHGQTSSYTDNFGNYSLERYRAVLLAPNWGANFSQTGNTNPTTSPGLAFGASTGTCTSGFYNTIFNDQASPSKDCISAISSPLQSMTLLGQDIAEFDAQGSLFELPAGMLKAAIGASYRANQLQFNPDQLQSQLSWNDQVAGLYPAGFSKGTQTAKEGYGELLVPVLKDLPFIKEFNLELGARYSTYDVGGTGWTYKILGDYKVTDWARIRGGYNKAVRAPSVGEAYFAFTQNFSAGASFGDPCSLQSTASWGAGGADDTTLAATTPAAIVPATVANSNGLDGAISAYDICKALMGTTGASQYYASAQAATAPTLFAFDDFVGNNKLKPEGAATWTAGVVLTSPMQNPWVNRMSMSVDFYSIKISDAIAFRSADYAKALCYGQLVVSGGVVDTAALNAAVASQACQNVLRNQTTGGEDRLVRPYDNLATIWTSGVDAQLNWGMDFADMGLSMIPGSISVNILANYLIKLDTKASPLEKTIQWAGSLGPNLDGTQQGAFAYKLNSTVSYAVGPATVGLTWIHRPSASSVSHAVAQANGTTNSTRGPASHDEFDLFGNYTVNDTLSLRAGINNLFDSAPEITGRGTGLVAPGAFPAVASSGQGTTLPGLYDAIGRRFFVGAKIKY